MSNLYSYMEESKSIINSLHKYLFSRFSLIFNIRPLIWINGSTLINQSTSQCIIITNSTCLISLKTEITIYSIPCKWTNQPNHLIIYLFRAIYHLWAIILSKVPIQCRPNNNGNLKNSHLYKHGQKEVRFLIWMIWNHRQEGSKCDLCLFKFITTLIIPIYFNFVLLFWKIIK
jgi:hypothetical protein